MTKSNLGPEVNKPSTSLRNVRSGALSVQKSESSRSRKETCRPWTAAEINKVKAMVNSRIRENEAKGLDPLDFCWQTLAREVPGRTGKQCREKWKNDLRPDISKLQWEPQEEYVMAVAHSWHGNKWAEISKYLPHRAENTIKNHWYATNRSKSDGRPKSFLWIYGQLLRDGWLPNSNLGILEETERRYKAMVAEFKESNLPHYEDIQVDAATYFVSGPGKKDQEEKIRASRPQDQAHVCNTDQEHTEEEEDVPESDGQSDRTIRSGMGEPTKLQYGRARMAWSNMSGFPVGPKVVSPALRVSSAGGAHDGDAGCNISLVQRHQEVLLPKNVVPAKNRGLESSYLCCKPSIPSLSGPLAAMSYAAKDSRSAWPEVADKDTASQDAEQWWKQSQLSAGGQMPLHLPNCGDFGEMDGPHYVQSIFEELDGPSMDVPWHEPPSPSAQLRTQKAFVKTPTSTARSHPKPGTRGHDVYDAYNHNYLPPMDDYPFGAYGHLHEAYYTAFLRHEAPIQQRHDRAMQMLQYEHFGREQTGAYGYSRSS